MIVADVMVSNVITVGPRASVKELADILFANRISAVPVVGEHGELIGIVSDSDLMRHVEISSERCRFRWLELLLGNQAAVAEYVGTDARKVADVMTREVITATLDMPLREVAALLERNSIRRAPVVSGGKLVGIVTHANLIQALATAHKEVKAATATSDSMIREELMSLLDAEPWARSSRINVIVHDGTAELWGIVRSHTEKQRLRALVETVSGVRSVHDNLLVRPKLSPARSLSPCEPLVAAPAHD
jgi:CBS domain-containing protein